MFEVEKSERQPFLSEAPEIPEPDSRHRGPPNRGTIFSHIFVFILTSLVWALLFVSVPLSSSAHNGRATKTADHGRSDLHNITSNAQLLTCGTTIPEARGAGCKYDMFLNNWIPAPCYDEEWITEYKEDRSWRAFADENLTKQLTVEEMSEADFYYTSLRDHINHCAIMWSKQFWVLYEERPAFDTIIASPGHTEHCAQFLMDSGEIEATQATKTEVGFAGCWVRNDL